MTPLNWFLVVERCGGTERGSEIEAAGWFVFLECLDGVSYYRVFCNGLVDHISKGQVGMSLVRLCLGGGVGQNRQLGVPVWSAGASGRFGKWKRCGRPIKDRRGNIQRTRVSVIDSYSIWCWQNGSLARSCHFFLLSPPLSSKSIKRDWFFSLSCIHP